jgi:uncharacterized protein
MTAAPAPDPDPASASAASGQETLSEGPGSVEISLDLADGIGSVPRDAWDSLANPAGVPRDPFLSWDFLEALEASGCVGGRTGWQARPLLAREGAGALVGAAPVYVKTHSQGEYIFDHALADAWERSGGQWYPKLTCAVPFTPVPGRRLLAGSGPLAPAVAAGLAQGLAGLAVSNGLSTAQVNFPEAEVAARLRADGWLVRTDRQFHFLNTGYRDFHDFLDALSSEKRKNLRKERARAVEGLTVERLSGADLSAAHWDFFYRCYLDTGSRKWGSPYLNRAFFELVHQRMKDQVVMVVAREGSRMMAAALNFLGSHAIYGRHWGRLEDRPFLHFELCYYQAIDAALERGLQRVEAGAQGGHKLARGYEPVETYQAMWLTHDGFRQAVARYVREEQAHVQTDNLMLKGHTPFRKGDRVVAATK